MVTIIVHPLPKYFTLMFELMTTLKRQFSLRSAVTIEMQLLLSWYCNILENEEGKKIQCRLLEALESK